MRRLRFAVVLGMLLAASIYPMTKAAADDVWPYYWDPGISASHASSCDNVLGHKERVYLTPGSNLTLAVSVDPLRLNSSTGLVYYAVNGGTIQTLSGTKTGNTWSFTIPGTSLPEGTRLNYAFLIQGSFGDLACTAYTSAVWPSKHGFEAQSTATVTRQNKSLWWTAIRALQSGYDQPGFSYSTPVATVCSAFFVSQTPCELYADVGTSTTNLVEVPPVPLQIVQSSSSATSMPKTCTLKNTSYYYAFENSSASNPLGGQAFVEYGAQPSQRRAGLYTTANQGVVPNTASASGAVRSGFKFSVGWTPAGSSVHVQQDLKWRIDLEKWAFAVGSYAAHFGGGYAESNASVNSAWKDFTSGGGQSGGTLWTANGARADVPFFGIDEDPVAVEASPLFGYNTATWQVALIDAHEYAFYVRGAASSIADIDGIGNGVRTYMDILAPDLRSLEVDSLKLTILDADWYFTECPG